MSKDVERSQTILPPRGETAGELEQSPTFRRPRRRRVGLFVSLALVALAAIVVLTGLLMLKWLACPDLAGYGVHGTGRPLRQAAL